jgi:signal transduction histidine kinase/HD-like signal output (HDOD) protein/ActR/RegA family two-component response regulator
MQVEGLRTFVETLDQLPSLPAVGVRLIETSSDKNCSLKDVARVIESDQSLTAKLLKMANSAAFGLPRRVSTVERATGLLGLELVRSMALSILVFDLFKDTGSRNFRLVDFWRHSVACGVSAELIAGHFAYPKPQEAFVAGLLHDLGKLVFYHWNREQYETVVTEARRSRRPLLQEEESQLGFGHGRAAKILLEYWHFPPELIDSAWLHHQPLSHFNSQPMEQLAFIVKCANSLCHVQRLGDSGNPAGDLDAAQLERAISLSATQITEISAAVLRRLDELSEFFDIDACTPEMYVAAMSRANQELAQLHVALSAKSRQLEHRQRMLQAIRELNENMPAPMSPGRALERVVEHLAQTLNTRRLMGFLVLEREGIIAGRLKIGPEGPIQHMTLALEEPASKTRTMNPREQFSLIEKAVLQLGEDLRVATEVAEALRSANLIVLPLDAGGITLGQLLVEPESPSDHSPDTIELLRQYAKAAVLGLERSILFEALEQQAEDMARMARKGQEVQTRLLQAERLASVGRLAAGAAHEINNPLAAISAQAQLLLRRAKEEKDAKGLQSIVDQAKRISKIISDLMGFARPAEPRIEPTVIKDVLEHTLSVVESRVKNAGVVVERDYQPDFPLVYADAKQLEQVFLNLTINAIQAMKTGGTLHIRLAVDQSSGRAKIEFSDTGMGIQPDRLPAIFDPFYTTKEDGEGTGLGLAISHSIIESHRGEIKVRSVPGKGTTFTILLPVGENVSRLDEIRSDLSQHLRPVPSRSSSAGSVLVVDDEEALQNILSETLSQEGYEVDLASDGLEALEKLSSGNYDVMLLDLRMPHKEGMDVLRSVRKSNPALPVIVVSGLARDEDFAQAEKAGAFACIKKPFDTEQLLGTVKRAIKKKAARGGQAGGSSA